jgi:hypothetical protein
LTITEPVLPIEIAPQLDAARWIVGDSVDFPAR